MFLYVPSEKSGQAYKFAVSRTISDSWAMKADLRPVSRPCDQTIRVALSRLRRCPEEIDDPSCPATDTESQAPSVESESGMTLQKLLNKMKHQVVGGAIYTPERSQARTLATRTGMWYI